VYIVGVLDIILVAMLFLHKIKLSSSNLILIAILTACFTLGIIYGVRIINASACVSGMEYAVNSDKVIKTEQYEEFDESADAGVSQLKVYVPQNNNSKICMVHINYGGWSVQTPDSGMYLEKFCEKHGYAFVQLAGVGKEEGDIADIVKSIKKGICYVQGKYNFEQIYLIGESAGGHLALVTAFSGSMPEIYGEDQLSINGVIALYSPTDMEYQYRYFVEKHPAKNIFGKMGDWLFCSLFHGDTGTLRGETAKIQEQIIGTNMDKEEFYRVTNVINLIQNQNLPILLIHGDKDTQLGMSDNIELYNNLSENHKAITFLTLPGVDHAYDIVFPESTYQGIRSLAEINSWMGTVTKLEKTK
jgi:dienelactone hydrolase